MRVSLSPTKLSLFKECPRCFYDTVFMGLPRPRGAYPTLPGAIDEAMKKYCDLFRDIAEMPIQLKGFVDGMHLLTDQRAIDRMRDWKGGLSTTYKAERTYGDKAITHDLDVQGAIDELLIDPDTDSFAIPDFKTRRSAPDEGYSKKYYQTPMDCYAFLLREMGFEPNGRAFLWYMWPLDVKSVDTDTLTVAFGSTVQELVADPEETVKLLDAIADITPKDKILQKSLDEKRPSINPDCEYCNYKRGVKHERKWG